MKNNEEFRKDVYDRFDEYKEKKAATQRKIIKFGSMGAATLVIAFAAFFPVTRIIFGKAQATPAKNDYYESSYYEGVDRSGIAENDTDSDSVEKASVIATANNAEKSEPTATNSYNGVELFTDYARYDIPELGVRFGVLFDCTSEGIPVEWHDIAKNKEELEEILDPYRGDGVDIKMHDAICVDFQSRKNGNYTTMFYFVVAAYGRNYSVGSASGADKNGIASKNICARFINNKDGNDKFAIHVYEIGYSNKYPKPEKISMGIFFMTEYEQKVLSYDAYFYDLDEGPTYVGNRFYYEGTVEKKFDVYYTEEVYY